MAGTQHIDIQYIDKVERPFDVEVTLPGSKSIALRHLLMSSLATGKSTLAGVPKCDDIDAMIGSLRNLGVALEEIGTSHFAIDPPDALLAGDIELDLDLSGVSLRLLLAVAALRPNVTRFDGRDALRGRPNHDMIDALEELGCTTTSVDGGRLPITVAGPEDYARHVSVGTGISSQYLSGLLLVAPLLPDGLTIRMKDELVSAPYAEITRVEMAKRGAIVETVDENTMRVAPQAYAGGAVTIEGDASAATYHAALATLHGSTARITNLGASTTQGDFAFIDLCRRLGAVVEVGNDSVTIKGPDELALLDAVDMQEMPDAATTLMAMAPFLQAPIHITGLSTLRHKECDRIACPIRELAKSGVHIDEGPDHVTVSPVAHPQPARFDTYDDHRMAMSLAVFASKVGNCEVLDPGCVSKTYADFWRDFERVYD